MSESTRSQLENGSFLTAGGTETYLVFQQGFELREFCAFEVFEHPDEVQRLESDYLFPLMSSVAEHGQRLLLDALVWRAHPDFVATLGYQPEELRRLNQQAVASTREIVARWRNKSGIGPDRFPVLISADIGPRGDGYRIEGGIPTADAAFNYHRAQLEALADSDIDVVFAQTMTNANEACGIVRAASGLNIPVIISATVETDGRLPDGTTLGDFIQQIDAASDLPPVYYMVNCAHPSHLVPTLNAARKNGEAWVRRFKGFRANSSCKSHEELDNSTELDRGNPAELAAEVAEMKRSFDLNIVGGCCGTDHEHIAAMAKAAA